MPLGTLSSGDPLLTAVWDATTGWPSRPSGAFVLWRGPKSAGKPAGMLDGDWWGQQPDRVPPATPAGLSATSSEDRQSTLAWTAVVEDDGAHDFAWYLVYVSADGGSTYTVWPTVAAPTHFTTHSAVVISDLNGSVAYKFKVTAVDLDGNPSGFSNIATGTPVDNVPAAPTSASPYVVPGATNVTIYWTSSTSSDLDHEEVRYHDHADSAGVFSAWVSTSPGSTIDNLVTGHTYDFEVRAVDAIGQVSATSLSGGNYSNITTTAPTTPILTWLNALDATKVKARFFAGEITGYADGASLTTWTDHSTGAHDLGTSGLTPPVYTADGGATNWNHKPVVTFAPNARMVQGSVFSFGQPWTIFVVARRASGSGAVVFTDGITSTTANRARYAANNATPAKYVFGTTSSAISGNAVDATSKAIVGVANGSSSKFYMNPSNKVAPYTGAAGSNSPLGLTVGGVAGAVGTQLTGEVALVVVMSEDASLDGTVVADFYTAVAAEYGIS